jgi:hypothetical protein
MRWRRGSGARRIVFAWAAFGSAMTLAQLLLAYRGPNIWLSYLSTPTESCLALWALSAWQINPLARQTIRIAIPGSLAVYLVLVLLVENTRSFSGYALPLYGLLGLGAALYTLVSRATDETEALWRNDWFWIAGGMALYFGTVAVLMPTAGLLIASRQDLVASAWQLFGLIGIFANIAVAVGMLCPISAQPRSGASSLPARSASASPSPPSSRR